MGWSGRKRLMWPEVVRVHRWIILTGDSSVDGWTASAGGLASSLNTDQAYSVPKYQMSRWPKCWWPFMFRCGLHVTAFSVIVYQSCNQYWAMCHIVSHIVWSPPSVGTLSIALPSTPHNSAIIHWVRNSVVMNARFRFFYLNIQCYWNMMGEIIE